MSKRSIEEVGDSAIPAKKSTPVAAAVASPSASSTGLSLAGGGLPIRHGIRSFLV